VIGPFAVVRDSLRAGRPVSLATVVEVGAVSGSGDCVPVLGAKMVVLADEHPVGSIGSGELDDAIAHDARAALQGGRSVTRHYGYQGEPHLDRVSVFIEVFARPPRMVILGAMDFSAALVRQARLIGFHVSLCDARATFATRARFPEADEVVVDWPHRYLASVGDHLGPSDAVCVLTHDNRFDVPAIVAALATKVGYIGALGSRTTHAQRVERLREAGVGDVDQERIMAPIGIDIGARAPEETAVSICAEIIALRAGVPVLSLRSGSGPIHRAMA
jgi:xanthine dehydrogenase accessory factor